VNIGLQDVLQRPSCPGRVRNSCAELEFRVARDDALDSAVAKVDDTGEEIYLGTFAEQHFLKIKLVTDREVDLQPLLCGLGMFEKVFERVLVRPECQSYLDAFLRF